MKEFLISVLKACFMNCYASTNMAVSKISQMTLNTMPVQLDKESTTKDKIVIKCGTCIIKFSVSQRGYINGIDVEEADVAVKEAA